MESALNPFTPGSGHRPPALEGRDQEIEMFDLLVARSKKRLYDRGLILSGLRGVGKTTLLNLLAEHAEHHGWLTIFLEARPNSAGEAAIRSRLAAELTRNLRRYSRKHQVQDLFAPLASIIQNFGLTASIGPASVKLDLTEPTAASGQIDIDFEEVVESICERLTKRNSVFALFIDEMQELDASLLGAMLTTQHRATQQGWPFYIFGAGLPNLPEVLTDNRSYAERQFRYRTIGPLSPDAAGAAIQHPIEKFGAAITPEALNILVEASGCYPFFLQEFGKAVWDEAPTAPFSVEDAHIAVQTGLDSLDAGFFPSRWNRATDAERRYLRAIAQTGEEKPRSGKIAEVMGVARSASLSALRDSTIKKGLIWAPEHGRVTFTVPFMADFIRRQPTE